MKKISVFALPVLLLTGCVNNTSFDDLQRRVAQLEQTVSGLDSRLSTELSAVKKRRNMPMGAPMYTKPRNTAISAAETSAYEQASDLYRSGDVEGSVRAFEQFALNYPQSSLRPQALYYLGQAAYTGRNYMRSQQALEALVYQPVDGTMNDSVVHLLKKVYLAQGKKQKVKELDRYMKSLRSNTAGTQSASMNMNSASTNPSATLPTGNQPLRPSTIR